MNDNIDNTLKDIQIEELIASYLRGEMTTDEERSFMAKIESDKELKEKAILMARMAKAMEEVGKDEDKDVIESFSFFKEDIPSSNIKITGETERIKEFLSNIIKRREEIFAINLEKAEHARLFSIDATNVNSSRKNLKIILSIAASLVIVFVLGYRYIDYNDTTGLGNEYATSLDESSYMRGIENTDVAKELHVLFMNVKEGKDLEATISKLSDLWQKSTEDTYNDYTNFAPQIGWNLSIAYLKDNNKKDAKATLEKLCDICEEGTVIRNKVEEILKKL